MADLSPLIRLRKYRVEEKQKILAELFRAAEKIEARKAMLLAQRDQERQLAEELGDFETHTAYTLFAERVRAEIELLDQDLAKLNVRIGIAQDAMREAFGELKKIEIIQRTRKEEQAKAALKKEGLQMDEVGIQRFARDQDEKSGGS